MPRRSVVLVVALAAVLAGCPGLTGTDASPTQTPSEHPWRGETLVVSIETADGDFDRYRPLVREALAYWEDNAKRYAYPVSFELRPNASDPDINVQIVDHIYECGNEEHTAGCTLQPVKPGAVPDTAEFEVRRDLSDDSMTAVMKHELGHLLGLNHGDRPKGVMNAEFSGTVRDQPEAQDRSLPWNRTDLRVHVDTTAVAAADRETVDRQVAEALGYYEAGADGTIPDNVTLRRVDDRASADVRVTITPAQACDGEQPVCVTLDGTDVDGDDDVEWYRNLSITVAGTDAEATGWYVARGLAPGFGLTTADELPPPLRDASASDRRSEWWG